MLGVRAATSGERAEACEREREIFNVCFIVIVLLHLIGTRYPPFLLLSVFLPCSASLVPYPLEHFTGTGVFVRAFHRDKDNHRQSIYTFLVEKQKGEFRHEDVQSELYKLCLNFIQHLGGTGDWRESFECERHLHCSRINWIRFNKRRRILFFVTLQPHQSHSVPRSSCRIVTRRCRKASSTKPSPGILVFKISRFVFRTTFPSFPFHFRSMP